MTSPFAVRPTADEHVEYYGKYVAKVADGDLLETLAHQHAATVALIRANTEAADHAYGEGKWTVKEVLGHIADAERIFMYRALRFARNDHTDLPGFDENMYVDNSSATALSVEQLIEELGAVRQSTITLGGQLGDMELSRRGAANRAPVSVRALFWIAAGHEAHHVELLRERYGLVQP